MEAHLDHVGVGCNRVVNAASWGPSGLVAFGAHHAVALYDPEEAKIVLTLPGHSDRVNCTEWLPRHAVQLPTEPAVGSLPLLLISGDASGTIIVWAQHNPLSRVAATTLPKTFRADFVLAFRIPAAHSRAVTCLVSHVLVHPRSIPNPKALLVSTSSDGTVKIWGVDEGGGSGKGLVEVNCVQTIPVGPKAMMSAAVTELSHGGEGLLLALGGLDNAVHLYVGSGDLQFSKVCSLTGHQDWVRSLDFGPRPKPSPSSPPLLLASGSQDRNVRIWRIAPRRAVFEPGPASVCGQTPNPSANPAWHAREHVTAQPSSTSTFANPPAEGSGSGALEGLAKVNEAGQPTSLRGEGVSPEATIGNAKKGGSTNAERDETPDLTGFMSLLHMYAAGPVFRVGAQVWEASLESLLIGHEDWVHSVRWAPPPGGAGAPPHGAVEDATAESSGRASTQNGNSNVSGGSETPAERAGRGSEAGDAISGNVAQDVRPSILSASMDRTMMIWRPDARTGLWQSEVTVGELGVSNLGFYTGLWSPTGDAILAHGYAGSFHLWRNGGSGLGEDWRPGLAVSGHFGPISDCEWDRGGRFLLSVSQDQTARVRACWEWGGGNAGLENGGAEVRRDSGGGASSTGPVSGRVDGRSSWHEIARPQVHGHDIHCATWTGGSADVSTYVSGSEEKVARVFQAPEAFVQTLRNTARSGGSLAGWTEEGRGAGEARSSRGFEGVKFLGANMSALGLSQKPIYTAGGGRENGMDGNGLGEGGMGAEPFDTVPEAAPKALGEPPLEEHLAQNTLWPEVRKLYGHGNELWCMAGDHSGRLLATASKAQSAAAAAIWLWDVDTWQPMGQLSAHQLTVTQLEFSPNDDRFLLAVSRDRHLSLWERTDFAAAIKSDGKDDASAVNSTGRRAAGDDETTLGSKGDGKSDGKRDGKRDGNADAKGSAPSTGPGPALSSSGRGDESQAEGGPKHEGGAKQDGDDREEEGLGSWIKEGSYLDRRSAAPTSERGPPYRLVAKVEAHKRIVWAASWAPNGRTFATGSRDKLVKLWGVSDGADGRAAGVRQVGKLPVFSESVTALAWGARGILAVGLENGGLELWQGEPSGLRLTRRFEAGLCHVAAVQRIRWKSGPPLEMRKVGGDLEDGGRADGKRLQMATCGADHAVRIFSVEVP